MRYRWIDRIDVTGDLPNLPCRISHRSSRIAIVGYAAVALLSIVFVITPISWVLYGQWATNGFDVAATIAVIGLGPFAKLAVAAALGTATALYAGLMALRALRRRIEVTLNWDHVDVTKRGLFLSRRHRFATADFQAVRRFSMTEIDGRYDGVELVHADPRRSILLMKSSQNAQELTSELSSQLRLPEMHGTIAASPERPATPEPYGQPQSAMA